MLKSGLANDLALDLKQIFSEIFKHSEKPVSIRFEKVREHGRVIGMRFLYPAQWPEASYDEINAALLFLHHMGFIIYGANVVKLNACFASIKLDATV